MIEIPWKPMETNGNDWKRLAFVGVGKSGKRPKAHTSKHSNQPFEFDNFLIEEKLSSAALGPVS